jgi:ATP-binding cassette subfamily A (ABC1) protein 3
LNGNSLDLAYVPMKTVSYNDVPSKIVALLSQNFPFFLMVVFLIPLYYIVSKLAEEKESRSREGMKMMGLNDFTYYLSWFIFYVSIVIVMSLISALIVGYSTFD